MSLVGNLATMGLEEILQWVSLGRKTGTLVIARNGDERRLVFEDGALVGVLPESADAGLPSADRTPSTRRSELQARAERSVAELLRWPSGDFQFVHSERPAQQKPPIALSATALLLNAAHRLDEAIAAGEEERTPSTAGATTASVTPSGGSMLWRRANEGPTSHIVLPSSTAVAAATTAQDEPTAGGAAEPTTAAESADDTDVQADEPESTIEVVVGQPTAADPASTTSDVTAALDAAPPPLFVAQSVRRRPASAYLLLGLGVIALCASVALLASLARRSGTTPSPTRQAGAPTSDELPPNLIAQVDARTEEMEAALREQYISEIDRLRRELELERQVEHRDLGPVPPSAARSTVRSTVRSPVASPAPGSAAQTRGDAAPPRAERPRPNAATPPIDVSLGPATAPPLAARFRGAQADEGGPQAAPAPAEPTPTELGERARVEPAAGAPTPPDPVPAAERPADSPTEPAAAPAPAAAPRLERVVADAPVPRDGSGDAPAAASPLLGGAAPVEAQLAKAIALSPSSEPSLAPLVPDDLVANEADVVEPVLLRRPAPRYPVRARRQNQRAQVGVQILVDSKGRVAEVSLAADPVGQGFDEAALAAARRTRWEPARDESGEPVSLWVNLLYEFSP